MFPEQGISWTKLKKSMQEATVDDAKWHDGRMTQGTYYVSDELGDKIREAYSLFIHSNQLYSKRFYASLNKFENDIIEMSRQIFNGPQDVCGTVTTGGTESIICAIKAARNWARKHKPEIKKPRIVIPETAHPSFNKAAVFMDLEVERVPYDEGFRADVGAMEAAIDENTIAMIGSAPCWPFGTPDPIAELSEVAARHNIWFHVDGCLGGFLNPFTTKLGYDIPPWDFSIPGVWSISADLHKYGYATKGASVIMFRNEDLREFSAFRFNNWPFGSYLTTTMTGSRSGGAVAAAWAVMQYLGEEGYVKAAHELMKVRDKLIKTIEEIEELQVYGQPSGAIVAYGSTELDITAVADAMEQRDWAIGRGKKPPAILFQSAPLLSKSIDQYIEDLKASVVDVREGRVVSSGKDAGYN
jgi:sphinganine-1-phosphate aldolase